MDYARPASVEEAVALLAGGGWRPLAGGTDVYPALGEAPLPALLDLTGIPALAGVRTEGDGIRIGALTTWSALVATPLPAAFDALKAAAREVGGVQVQNTGTVAGNICNASPAADGMPPLLALDAVVELTGPDGARRVPLGEFVVGPRQTLKRPEEIVTALFVPQPGAIARSAFLKLGARTHLVISIAMTAAVVTLDEAGRVARAALSVGACGPVARRLADAEAAVVGLAPGEATDAALAVADLPELSPIDDVRATAAYRQAAARRLLARTVRLAGGAGEDGQGAVA
ncbi:MAG: FAD binding domain-containing protein [Pseudomonadota bacterium]